METKEIKRKIVLLGDGAVGKTSLINNYVHNTFDEKYLRTIGVRISQKMVRFRQRERQISLNFGIWDLYGQKEDSAVRLSAFAGINGVIMVADMTRMGTLKSLVEYWYPLLKGRTGSTGEVPIIIFGNKSDLKDQMELQLKDLEKVFKPFGFSCFLSSAKTGLNVQNGFTELGLQLLVSKGYDPRSLRHISHFDERIHMKDISKKIIQDFIFLAMVDDVDELSPFIKTCLKKADVDLLNATIPGLIKLIELLRIEEEKSLGKFMAQNNADNRISWVNAT